MTLIYNLAYKLNLFCGYGDTVQYKRTEFLDLSFSFEHQIRQTVACCPANASQHVDIGVEKLTIKLCSLTVGASKQEVANMLRRSLV